MEGLLLNLDQIQIVDTEIFYSNIVSTKAVLWVVYAPIIKPAKLRFKDVPSVATKHRGIDSITMSLCIPP
jgi:hypothetical protein